LPQEHLYCLPFFYIRQRRFNNFTNVQICPFSWELCYTR